MNIYLPDELAADVRAELGEANMSGITQSALRAELTRTRALKALGEDFERVEARDHNDMEVAFKGRLLGGGSDTEAYLTPKQSIAVVADGQLYVYKDYEEFIGDLGETHDQEMVSAVADALGEKYVRELDI
jgi:post-segregation antitoxin (ccd killing protein)